MPVAVTWLGHSTVLVEAEGARLLTDPVLRSRVAHLTRRGDPVSPTTIGHLDAALLSHVHRDHLDLPTLRALPAGVPVVAPPGAARAIPPSRTVRELAAGEATDVAGVRVRATPAEHEVRRGFREHGAVGYVVAERVYFAGDTDLFAEMEGLGEVDVALLPVWGWGTSLGPGHLDPAGAAEAVARLRPRVAVPIHWGTYFPAHRGRGGHRLLDEPPREFARLVAERAPECRVVVPAIGERLEL